MTVEKNIDIAGEHPISDEPEMGTDYFFCSGERARLLKEIAADLAEIVPVIVLSGEKGEGKSSLCRMLVKQVPADCRVIYFEKTVESFEDVVRVIAAKIDCGEVDVSRMAMQSTIDQIGARLKELDIRIVAIFDGAEMIYLATMERIRRMLDQLNEPEVRMQVVVSGRPLLLEHMAQLSIVKFREVDEKQYSLSPLSEADTASFVDHLTTISEGTTGLFSQQAIEQIYQLTGGNAGAIAECVQHLLESDDREEELAALAAGLDHGESSISRLISSLGGAVSKLRHIPRRTLAIGGGVCLALLLIVMFFSADDEEKKVTDDSLPPPPPQIEQRRPEPPQERELVKGEELKQKQPLQTLDPAKKEVHKGKVEPEFNVAKKPAPKPTVVEPPPVQKKKVIPPPPPPPEKEVVADEVKPVAKPIVVEKEAEKKKPVKEAARIGAAVVAGEAAVDAVKKQESAPESVTIRPPAKPEEKISSAESKVAHTPPPVQLEIEEPEIPHLHAGKEKHLIGIDEPATDPAPGELDVPVTEMVSEEPQEETTDVVVQEVEEPIAEALSDEPEEQTTETLPQGSEESDDEVVLQVMTPNTPPLIIATDRKVTHTPPIEREDTEIAETTPDTPVAQPAEQVEIPEPIAPQPPAKKIAKPMVETAVVAPKIEQSYGAINSEAILANRIGATKSWLTGEKDDKYTIQLIILTSMFAEEKIINLLSRREYAQAARNFYVLERKGNSPAYFVYYGEYDDLDEAKRAQSTIPLFLRNHRPYVLSIPSALEKMDN